MSIRIYIAAIAALLATAVHGEESQPAKAYRADDAVYQLAPSATLVRGLLEGSTHFRELLRYGDFGLGALSPVDGEVIILDGTVFHASHRGGRVREVAVEEQTPFAYIKRFVEDRRVELPPAESFQVLTRELDRQLPSPNLLYAVRIDGVFDYLKLRSVPPQKPPFAPIGEVVRQQKIFEARNIRGTLVAFRFPAYLGSVSGSGHHMHFVDAERRIGGHLLELRTSTLTASIDESYGLNLILPDDAAFKTADFSGASNPDAFGRAVRPAD